MADPFTIMAIASTGMKFIGGMQQAAGIKAAGKAQRDQARYQAESAKVAAGQQRASAQRAAIEDRRQGVLAQSRAAAVAGAGGGSVGDVSNIIGDIGAESRYAALTSLYGGEDRARDLETRGKLALYEGESAYRAAKTDAGSTRMKAFSELGTSLFSKYAPQDQETIYWNQGGSTRI
jgi:hypothetical protein